MQRVQAARKSVSREEGAQDAGLGCPNPAGAMCMDQQRRLRGPEQGEQDPEGRNSEPARDGSRARCNIKVKYNKDETGPLEGKQEITGDLTSVGFREESGLQARYEG